MESREYRLMIYFAVTTIHMYSDGLKIHKTMNSRDFYEARGIHEASQMNQTTIFEQGA